MADFNGVRVGHENINTKTADVQFTFDVDVNKLSFNTFNGNYSNSNGSILKSCEQQMTNIGAKNKMRNLYYERNLINCVNEGEKAV